ncbi:UNVERIFIED_ORG: ABC-type amino acid transport substrate-binding protein [Pseudomonas reinekei]|nr:ABC-type amino acid transport substrate-binding protein [Pseudomonas reinekei]
MPRLPTVLFLLSLMTWTATAGALTLTEDERSWLAAHPDLRLGVDASWPPFEFRDDEGSYQGLAADYIEVIRQRLKTRLTPIEPVSWTAVLEQAKKGKIDLLLRASCRPRNARNTCRSPAPIWIFRSSSWPMSGAPSHTTCKTCMA